MWCLECEALTTDERCIAEHSFCSAERVVQEAARDIRIMQEAFAAGMRGAEKHLQIMRWVEKGGANIEPSETYEHLQV